MKRRFYVLAFTILGSIIGLLVYGLGSMILLQKNLTFDSWWFLRIMLLGGAIAGFFEGMRWWEIIYVERAHTKWPKHMREFKLLGLVLLIVLTIAILMVFQIKSS